MTSEENISSQSEESFSRRGSLSVSVKSFSRKSIASQISHRLSLSPVLKLRILNDEELTRSVEEVDVKARRLKTENAIILKFLKENECEDLDELDYMQTTTQGSRKMSILIAFLPQSVSAAQKDKDLKVNLNQKGELVLREQEKIQAFCDQITKKCDRMKFLLSSKVEELEMRRTDIEESIQNFETFKQLHEQISIDKFVHYMNEWSKRSRLLADKIRLRYSSSRIQYQKLSAILAHKQLIGENLKEIDFEQLRIENIHLTQKTEQLNLLLLELKKMTGAGNLKLSQHKSLLMNKMEKKSLLLNEIKRIEGEIVKSDDDLEKVDGELNQAKTEYDVVNDRVRQYVAPDIMDYVKTKLELENLKKDLKTWNRRKVIKETALAIDLAEMKKGKSRKVEVAW